MEFNDDDEEEAQEEETEEMNLHQNDTVYNSPRLDTTVTTTTTSTAAGLMILHTGNTTGNTTGIRFKYRECLKNQAVTIGGHALDGCGEFMPAGSEGTIDALKCAACNCHRNFHRKENNNSIPPPGFYRIPTPVSYQRPLPPPPPLALPPPPPPPQEEDLTNYKMDTSSAEGGGGGGGGGMRKRFRTKFTAEQKEMMLGLAERIGWRIQRQDDELISRFCQESGVSRQVLKVWLHNNKHTLGKSSSSSSPIMSHHHHHHQQNQHQSLFHQEQDHP